MHSAIRASLPPCRPAPSRFRVRARPHLPIGSRGGPIQSGSSLLAPKPRRLSARSPRSPATRPQYPAGSGVGVSVFLRETGGFEGLTSVEEGANLDHFPVAQEVEEQERLFDEGVR